MKTLLKKFFESITEEDKKTGYKKQVDFLHNLLKETSKEGIKNGFKLGFEIGSGEQISDKDFNEGFGKLIDKAAEVGFSSRGNIRIIKIKL